MFIIEKDLCITCGTCVDACHTHALSISEDELAHDREKCSWCGHCLAVCPKDAIMIDGDGYDIEDVEEFNTLRRPTVQQIRRQVMMRRSVRTFNEEEVTEEELAYILESAKYAPTAKNAQDNMLMVVQDPENRSLLLEESMEIIQQIARDNEITKPGLSAFFRKMYSLYKDEEVDVLFHNAPIVIYIFSDNELDGAICACTMMQMVEAQQGLGACYLQMPADPFNVNSSLKKAYGIPEDKKCVIAIALGHTDEEYFCSVPRKEVPIIWK